MDLLRILSDQREELYATDVNSFVARNEEAEIKLESSLAQVVIGVRRSGKSTLCQKKLLESGLNFAYVNFDDDRLYGLKTEQLDEVLLTLYRIYGEFTHLFLDEVQNIKGWPLFVNRLLRQKLHLIITGSNANLLSGELSTHLTGRYHEIRLFPFSFKEFCKAKNVSLDSFSTKAQALRLNALDKYLMQGGFPELNDVDAQNEYVQSLLSAVINKDICQRYRIRHSDVIWKLANVLLDRFGQEIFSNGLSDLFNVKSPHTIQKYISYLKSAFLLQGVPKFSFKSIERHTTEKLYSIDNAFIAKRDNVLMSDSLGWRLENVVAVELMRRCRTESEAIYYLRKHKSYEVDFVRVERMKVKQLIQVTYNFRSPSAKLYSREIGGLLKGSNDTGCDDLLLIMMDGDAITIETEGKKIRTVTAAEWLTNETEF